MSTNQGLITEFLGTWKTKDIDHILSYFTDDIEYINIPIDPANHGKEEVRKVFEQFMAVAEDMEVITHFQGETPTGEILNERTDRFLINGKWTDLPVMGIFETTDGKISKWRDYFDLTQFTKQMSGG